MIRKKKAEITTQQIVLLIILIASFAVILFFLVRLNLGKTSESEICHNSVVTRGSGVLPQESVPLNCKTSYICLTKDGSCEKMISPEIKKVKTKEDVYETLANEMADCWWMFGEGKLNYVGKDLLANNLYCSICSQISFDNSLDMFSNGEIDKADFYDYLSKTNMSGKDVSYLDYLMGMKTSQEIKNTLTTSSSSFGKINLEKQYYIIMGVVSDVSALKWVLYGAGAGAAVGLIVLTGGLGTPAVIAVAAGTATGGVGGYFAGTVIKGESGDSYMTPTIIEANSEDYKALKCKDIKTLS
jgi:hypothetical protein